MYVRHLCEGEFPPESRQIVVSVILLFSQMAIVSAVYLVPRKAIERPAEYDTVDWLGRENVELPANLRHKRFFPLPRRRG